VSCEARQEQLERIAFEGGLGAISDEAREHLAVCAPCSSQFALLRLLIREARDAQPATLSPGVRASVQQRASRALRATHSNPIFRWEIAAPLAVASLALPIAVGQGWLWAHGLSVLLEPWLPASVLTGLTIFYAASAALTLGGLYGSLPFAIAYANRVRLEAS